MAHEPAIVIPWRERRGQAAAYYAIGFAGVLAYLAVSSGTFQPVHRAIMASFVLAIAYGVAAQLINATTLSVRGGMLQVKHGPVPWRGRVELPVDDVRWLGVDVASKRLRLRTQQGEEIDLVEGVGDELGRRVDSEIAGLGIAS